MNTPTQFPGQPTESDRRALAAFLSSDRVGGVLLVAGALLGLLWANSPWASAFLLMRDARFGPDTLHLNLTVHAWIADGLLAVFFLLVGLELKRELVAGELRNPRTALVPVVAAMGGVVVPSLLFILVAAPGGSIDGWAIPVATDIAFALAVLALIGSRLPSAVRLFLLTLAVVDDLIGIVLIAVLSAKGFHLDALLWALVPLALIAAVSYGLHGRFIRQPALAWVLLPPALVVWWLIHEAGIHATIAGVLVAFALPALGRAGQDGIGPILEHAIRPFSAAVVVPLFALVSAGVPLGSGALGAMATDPLFWGVVAGLVIGKPVGILGSTWLLTRVRFASLDPSLRWIDIAGMSLLAGIGFTVSMLIAAITFRGDVERADVATLAVLVASIIAAVLATAVLLPRNRWYAKRAD
ncbi:MAG TPA: Na+/H+ antiporter NhaA [Microbacteriaceae bacterium]|nr:Na+/H+ antiporter NhaA [Microbacteriaceae bacterium]